MEHEDKEFETLSEPEELEGKGDNMVGEPINGNKDSITGTGDIKSEASEEVIENAVSSENTVETEHDDSDFELKDRVVKYSKPGLDAWPGRAFNLVAAMLYAIIISVGMQLGMTTADSMMGFGPVADAASTDMQKAIAKAEILNKIYYGESTMSKEELADLYLKVVAASLGDKYTVYAAADEVSLGDDLENNKSLGIGVLAQLSGDNATVIRVFEGSPADAAGVQAGDIIKKVGKLNVTAANYQRAIDSIRGEEGTTAKMVFERNGEEYSVDIKRGVYETQTVAHAIMSNNVGYLSISSFVETTAKEVSDALKDMQDCTALVIDLRRNGGGLLDSVIDVADMFLDKGVIITSNTTQDGDKVYMSHNGTKIDVPIAILTDGGTASASEVLTGTLRDRLGAVVVGERTYGKGVVCQRIMFADGSMMQVSIGEYKLPNGESINNIGIKPTVEIEADEEFSSLPEFPDEENDVQLKGALEALKNGIKGSSDDGAEEVQSAEVKKAEA